jgi:hypothetical protein
MPLLKEYLSLPFNIHVYVLNLNVLNVNVEINKNVLNVRIKLEKYVLFANID